MSYYEREIAMITDIYRIKTRNSVYEIHVQESGASRCRKLQDARAESGGITDGPWRVVHSDASYLEKLAIGPSFEVPGVVTTSVVHDYKHFVVSDEPKRTIPQINPEVGDQIRGFFQDLTGHIIEQANGGQVMVVPEVEEKTCEVEGCNYHPVPGGPNIHRVNPHCKSGGRPHCTCDYCF